MMFQTLQVCCVIVPSRVDWDKTKNNTSCRKSSYCFISPHQSRSAFAIPAKVQCAWPLKVGAPFIAPVRSFAVCDSLVGRNAFCLVAPPPYLYTLYSI